MKNFQLIYDFPEISPKWCIIVVGGYGYTLEQIANNLPGKSLDNF